MRIALLGLPQSGKRTLFALLTGRSVAEPPRDVNSVEGQAFFRDRRLESIAAIVSPKKTTSAEMTFVLCPDLGTDAPGRGWLDPAGSCDLLCVVLRAFTDESVYHPAGTVDQERDRSGIWTELLLADLELADRRLRRIEKEKRAGLTPAQALEEHVLNKCAAVLENEQGLNTLELEQREEEAIRSLGLLTLKPVIWVHNVDESGAGSDVADGVAIACLAEREIMEIENESERAEYHAALGLGLTGVERVGEKIFEALGLLSFYTIAGSEARAWAVPRGTTAPVAAGKIHSDMERGFIRAEVIAYDDFVAAGGHAAAKDQGKTQLRGKDYEIQDGDVCTFLFNV